MQPPQITHETEPTSLLAIVAKSLLSLGLLAGAGIVFVMLGSADPPPQRERGPQILPVETALATPHDDGLSFTVDGVVEPHRDVAVAAESAGRVIKKSVNCQVGQVVTAGEVLIQIDPRDYQLEVEQLAEELKQAEVSVAELVVEIESAKRQSTLATETVKLNERELQRMQAITTPGAVTDSEVDTARRELVNARIALQSQRDQRRLLEAREPRLRSVVDRTKTQLATAQLALERCVLRAPIDGVVTETPTEEGGYMQQGGLAFTVRDTSRLDVRCSLRADKLALVWAAADANATSAYAFPKTAVKIVYEIDNQRFAWNGVLARYDGAGLDEQTRMAPCLVQVDQPRAAVSLDSRSAANTPPTLLVGMFVEVQVQLNPKTPLLSIPVTALHPGNRVWVVEDNALQPQTARVADAARPDAVLVYADAQGLSAGAQVVVSPLASPTAGQQVRSPRAAGERSAGGPL